jgi:hypothetical protein
MHPADQFEAFRELIDAGSTPADIAARFGISEVAVKKLLKLARVSPVVFEAYRSGTLTLAEVQAFAVSDDHAAQERVLADFEVREISVASAEPGMTRQGMGASGVIVPPSARADKARNRLRPATTANLPRLVFLTISDCRTPCAAIEAVSSERPSFAPVLRTLPFQAVSLLRGIDAMDCALAA